MGGAMGRRAIVRVFVGAWVLCVCLAVAVLVSPRPTGAADEEAPDQILAALGLPKVVAITAGGGHYCLLGDDGSVWCWGGNNYGQLGNGTTEPPRVPVRVEGIPGRVQQVVAFEVSTCALTESGGVWCWGYNSDGQLGDGTKENRSVPTPVLGLDSGIATLARVGATSHMCAIRADGSAVCWGSNWGGQLGDGTTDERVGPVRVTVTNENLIAIAAESGTTCATTDRGAVRCWGALWADGEGKTEEGSATDLAAATPLGLGTGVKSLTASGDSACALLESGQIRCWTWGWDPDSYTVSSPWEPGPIPETVAGLPAGADGVQLTRLNWKEAPESQDLHTTIWACVTRDDRAWCWGNNDRGQLGDGTQTDRPSPVQVQTANIAELAIGHFSSLALLRDGSLVTWGNGSPIPRSPFGSSPVPTKPPTTGYREPDTLVPAITTHIPTPADISTDPPVVGANLLLAALAMIAFTIATELLNRTLAQSEPFLRRRLRPLERLDRSRARLDAALIGRLGDQGHGRLADALRILGIAAFYGIVFALLDPTWDPLTVTGLWLVLMMAVAFGLIGLSDDVASWAMARRWGVAGELAVRPGSLLAAIGSTVATRALVLVPGVMIGTPEALEIDEERLDTRRLGRLAGAGLGAVLVVGTVAWVGTLGTTALRGNGGALDVALGGLEAFLLLVFAVAVQNGFVQLLAFRGSAGRALLRAHRIAWAVALLGVTFAFWHTLVNPRGDLAAALGSTNVQAFLATVGIVLAVAVVAQVGLWVGRRRSTREPSAEGSALADAAASAPEMAPPEAISSEAATQGVAPQPVAEAPPTEAPSTPRR